MNTAPALSPTDSNRPKADLELWLNEQRIGLRPLETPSDSSGTRPSGPLQAGTVQSGIRPPGTPSPTEAAADEVPEYERQFLRARPELERATRVLHVSERVHRFIALLTHLPEGKSRPTVTEVMENLIDEHLSRFSEPIGQLRQEYCNRQLRAF